MASSDSPTDSLVVSLLTNHGATFCPTITQHSSIVFNHGLFASCKMQKLVECVRKAWKTKVSSMDHASQFISCSRSMWTLNASHVLRENHKRRGVCLTHPGFFYCISLYYFKIYFKDRVTEREKMSLRESLYPLIHSLKCPQRPRMSQGKTSILDLLDLPLGLKNPITWSVVIAFPGILTGGLKRNVTARTQTGTLMGHQHHRWRLNLLCHNAGLRLILIQPLIKAINSKILKYIVSAKYNVNSIDLNH